MPGCVPRSFQPCRSTPIPPQRTTPRRPCRSACPPELGPVAQAGVRYRPGTLPPLRRPFEDHRRHRTSPRHCEHPRPPRLARPGTAPIPGQGFQPIPTGLTSRGSPIHPVQPLDRLLACARRDAKTPRNVAPRADEGPDQCPGSRPRIGMLDGSRAQEYRAS
jgi:hypothetical protein